MNVLSMRISSSDHCVINIMIRIISMCIRIIRSRMSIRIRSIRRRYCIMCIISIMYVCMYVCM